jgi:hypothetical protein
MYNCARAIFGVECHLRDLLVHNAVKRLMGHEVKFAHERLCFYREDWKSRFILTLDDLKELKSYIVASIKKSPAIAILEILSMMSQKGKELKYLLMLLQDFDVNQPAPMSSIERFNPKNKTHAMNMKKGRVHLLVNVDEKDYMWAYDSSVTEFNLRKQLFNLLLSSDAEIIPEDIVKIIERTMVEKKGQWNTDHKKNGLVKFKEALEKAFIDGEVLVDIEPQEKVRVQVFPNLPLYHIISCRPNMQYSARALWKMLPVKLLPNSN